jgi:hypothetical protein
MLPCIQWLRDQPAKVGKFYTGGTSVCRLTSNGAGLCIFERVYGKQVWMSTLVLEVVAVPGCWCAHVQPGYVVLCPMGFGPAIS